MKKNLLFTFFVVFLNTSSFATLYLNSNILNDACNSGTGRVSVNVNGGATPYTYLWSPTASTTSSINNLFAGTYTCTVTDAVGSIASITCTVNNDNFLSSGYSINYSVGFTNSGGFDVYPNNGIPNFWVDDCLGNSYGPWNLSTGGVSPFLFNTYGCSNRTSSGLPYSVLVSDGNGCSLTIKDTIHSYGFANPTVTVYGACANTSNGQIIDTLVSYDDSLNFYWVLGYHKIYLYPLGSSIPIDSSISSYNPVYSFQNLAAGDYLIDYYISGNYSNSLIKFKSKTITIPSLGTSCGTISGDIYIDVNKNCAIDFAEPKENGALIEINPGPIYTNTDKNGHYSVGLNIGNYTIKHIPIYNSLLGVKCPLEPYSFSILTANNTIINLADTSPGLDLMSFICITTLRPNRNATIDLTVINESGVPAFIDSVVLHFDPILILSGTYPLADSTGPGYAIWYPPTQNALSWNDYTVAVTVPNNTNLLGTYASAVANIFSSQVDIDISNNYDSTSTMITGAYDPNHKSVQPEGFGLGNWVPISTPYFDYLIEFQNTGNDTAFDVVIVDTLDTKFDYSTFIPLSSSHPYTWKIGNDGRITFTFESIYLPDSGRNLEGSNGYVNYRISLNSNVSVADVITNTAWIYFDFNPPIATNTSLLTLFDCNQIVNSLPDTINSCEFNDFEFIAPTNVPALVTWKIDGTNMGSGDTLQLFSQLPLGNHIIELDASTPYCSQQKSMVWKVNANPVNNIYVNGNLLTCDATGTSYQWYDEGFAIPNATDTFYLATVSGNYSVVITNEFGCTTESSNTPFVVSVFEQTEAKPIIYCWPNPANEELNIQLSDHVFINPSIKIYDQLGKLIYIENLSQSNSSQTINLNVKYFAEGIYHLQITDLNVQYKLNWIKK